MKKATGAVLLLAGAVLVAGGIDKKSGLNNFVADVQADESEGQNTAADTERESLTSKIDTSIPVIPGSRIAVVSKSVNGEYWKSVKAGMEAAVKDINEAHGFSKDEEITMTFEGPSDEQDVATQVNTLDAVIAENPAVLCLAASDMDSCQAQLEAAEENGIPVVSFDSNVVDNDLVTSFIATDNTAVGQIAGEKLAEYLNGKGKVAVFSAQEKTESIQKRIEGFESAMSEQDGITVVKELYMDQVEDMSAAMTEVLESYPDLAGVFCTNEDTAELYLNLDKPEGMSPVLVGVDASSGQQEAIKNETEKGCVSQDPYAIGYQTILTAAYATAVDEEAGEQVPLDKEILMEPQWIDITNIEDEAHSRYLY